MLSYNSKVTTHALGVLSSYRIDYTYKKGFFQVTDIDYYKK